jgi:tetratricopeptide (TPR) repeat protein
MMVRRSLFYHLPLVALLLVLPGHDSWSQSGPPSGNFAITDVNVIPMDMERVVGGQTVVVADGIILSISGVEDADLPAGIDIIDGRGRYLLPGLADLHVHILHESDLVNNLAWGVTAVMHLGGSGMTGPEILALRKDISAGRVYGPNIYTTNRVFDGEPRLNSRSLLISDPQTARQEVRNLKADGYDFVKIYNNIAKEEFDATVAEARKVGLPVIGHIPRKFAALDALAGGQNAIAHTEELFFSYFGGPRSTDDGMIRDYQPDMSRFEPLLAVMVDNDVATMPDLAFTFTDLLMWDDLELLWNDSEYAYLHPRIASMWRAGNINRRSEIENFVVREQWKYELMLDLTKRFQDAGILQVIGTDASLPGLFPGKAAHRELTELVKAGLSNYDTLAVGTRNAGAFVRRYIVKDARFGQVLPGYRADLLLVDENPLDDIRNLRKISGVAANGRYLSKDLLDGLRDDIRDRNARLRGVIGEIDAMLSADDAMQRIQEILLQSNGDKETLAMVEAHVNAAGYAAANADNLAGAQEMLLLNTRLFPRSANAWDSLAEVTLEMGEREEALDFYRKALLVDPEFTNAAERIQEILAAPQN